MLKSFDCLIIGAGPSGLTLGIGLLRLGYTVLIAEKHTAKLQCSKSILVNTQTLKSLEVYGVTSKLRDVAIAVNGFTLYCWDIAVSSVEFDMSDSIHNKPIFIPQTITEQCLQDVYIELGGQLVRGYHFVAEENVLVNRKDNLPLDIVLRNESGYVTIIKCNWLFGCDGAHSCLRNALQVSFAGVSEAEQRYVVDAIINAWPFRTHANLWLETENAGGVLLILSNPLTARVFGATHAACEKLLNKLSVREIVWEGTFTNAYRVVQSYGRGRVWLVGNAAHVHSPLGGRGMNTGIAEALALARAIEASNVPNYEKQCRPKARRWVLHNFVLSQFIMGQGLVCKFLRSVSMIVLAVLSLLLGPRMLTVIVE